MYKIFFLVILFFQIEVLSAQNDSIVVRNISISGNSKTNDHVILREIDIKEGSKISLSSLQERLNLNKQRIISTGLFSNTISNINNWDTETNELDLLFDVKENWYIYPAVIFELADRSFNVWWKEQNCSFDRVNYGARLDHLNLTGNKDRLKLKLQFGYTRKFEIKYSYPYLNDKWGFTSEVFYSDNKEIPYKTEGNKLLFYTAPDENNLLYRFRTGITANKRSGYFTFQYLKFEFHNNWVDPIVSGELNADYFLNGEKSIKFFTLEYDVSYDKRELRQYPQGGYMFFGNIKKEGLGLFDDYNNLSLFAGAEYHRKIWDRLILGARLKGKTNLIRNKLAYANNTGLGYGGDVLTGYELYVLDGPDYIYLKTSNRLRIGTLDVNLGKYMPLKQFKRWPLDVYLKFDFDTGYVNEPSYAQTNTLNNQWLIGYAPGIDLLLFHNFIFSVEYHFNEQGESGLFLQSGFQF
jgi:outer membrane protein assembly factor BamA